MVKVEVDLGLRFVPQFSADRNLVSTVSQTVYVLKALVRKKKETRVGTQ